MRMVTGVVVGAVVAGVVAYAIWGRDRRDNPRSTVIVLDGAAATECRAKPTDVRIGNKRNQKIYFTVRHEDSACDTENNWELELRFGNASDGTVWNSGPIRVKKNGTTPWTVPNTANFGIFPYEIWMVDTATYRTGDPELEIEQF